MAGEFTKRTVDGENIWTCTLCNEDIISRPKPRGHRCQDQASPSRRRQDGNQSLPNSPFNPQFGAFPAPPQGFNIPTQSQQNQADMNALLRFQQLQAEQQKQMMILMQQQNQEMMRSQQEQNQQIMKDQQKQNETKMDQ